MTLGRNDSAPILTSLSNHRKGQKWTMNGRWRDSVGSRRSPNPGPGSYSGVAPSSYKYASSAAFGFGSGSRAVFTTDGNPGPNKYDTREMGSTHVSFSFGSAGRSSLAARSNTPGPGTYKLKNLVGNEGAPLYSCGKRCWHDPSKKRVGPSPNTYHPSNTNMPGTPKWSMGASQRSSTADGNARHMPGPGAYRTCDTVGVNNSTFKNTPTWSMRSRVYLPVPKNSCDFMCPPVVSFG